MKKLSFILVIFSLFVFVGCSDKKLDEIDIPDTGISDDTDNPDSTDSTDDSGDSQNNGDEDSADSTDDSGDSQSDDDADSADSTNDSGDSQNDDDADSADSANDSGDSQSDNDADSADSTNDSGDSQNDDDADSTDSTDDSSDSQNDDDTDTDTVDPEGCTIINLNPNFYVQKKGVYIGQVTTALGDATLYDLLFIEFKRNNIENIEYNLSLEENSNYATCKDCLTIIQDYENEEPKYYFQESGKIKVSNYNSSNYGLKATISAKLVETRFDENYNSTPVENGACIRIVSKTVTANNNTDNETCKNIMNCIQECDDNDSNCTGNCYISSTAVAKTQYEEVFECANQNNCEGDLSCYWEKCQEEMKTCGMNPDPNYKMPYGEVNISGTFNYLHGKDETSLSQDHILNTPFVTGTFGNNDTEIFDPTPTITTISFAKIGTFIDSEGDNIMLIQAKYKEDVPQNPVVEFVTTATAPGEFTLGLGDWTTGARIFVSKYDSEGNRICYHAFGMGTVSISAISSNWVSGETTITVEGSAKLYSPKATLDYGGDISDEWTACDPQ